MNESEQSFAFVAGVPGNRSAGMSSVEGELGTVLEGISILAGWRLTRSFSATVHAGIGRDRHEYELRARPRVQSYELRDRASGALDAYSWPSVTHVSDGETVALDSSAVVFEPLPVQLVFPLSLGVWGRPIDSWRMASGRREPGEIILGLRHRADVHLHGTLTIDLERRMAVRLDTPIEYCHYENVEPLSDELQR